MGWMTFPADAAGPAWSSRRVAVATVAGSWALYLLFIAVRLTIIRFPRELLLLERHLLTALAGAGLTWALYLLLRRLERASIVLRIIAAAMLALPAALLLTLIDYEILYVLDPERVWSARVLQEVTLRGVIARVLPEMYFVFTGWATLYTSVSSALESQEAQRSAAVLQAESRDAELRALRYQLNPHFLFNALNTVSALVMRGDADGAESTIQALSLFLRSALVTEAVEDTTLGEELDLQCLYLEIEQVRFGGRLRVLMAVPVALRPALLPPLLLQPLVENVIRHAVAPAPAPVTMTIDAFAEADRLCIRVEDDGRGGSAPAGTGIGLRNVEARLLARFGGDARCAHGPRAGGGFRVELVLPLRMQPVAGRAPPC